MDAMDLVNELPGVYPGGAFNEGLPNGKASGSLRAESDQLRLEYEGGHAELPLSGLEAAFGGAANRLIFFKHPEKPDWTFFTADRRILNDSTLNFSYGVAEQLARLRGSRRRSVAFWLVSFGMVVALIAGLVFAVVFNRSAMVEAVIRNIPASVEKEIGDNVLAELRETQTFIEEQEVLTDLDEMAQPIRAASGASGLKVYIIESNAVNAMAVPGGHVVVTSGLLLEAECSEEVLGVLAHETAHLTQRHSMSAVVSGMGYSLLLRAFFGDTGGLAERFAGLGKKLSQSHYSREQEREADRIGFDYLYEAKIDPRPMMEFFKRQEQKMIRSSRVEPEKNYLSSHPTFAERIAALEQWIGEAGDVDFTEVDLDYEAFKAKLCESMNLP